MTADQINELIKAKPFRSFRIVTTLGETFDVNSRDHIMVAGTTVLIGYDVDPADNVPEGFKHRGIEFIERLEPIRRAA